MILLRLPTPPRSPTSDIVPNVLPLRHVYQRTSHPNKPSEERIYQVDGSIENPNERNVILQLSGANMHHNILEKSCIASAVPLTSALCHDIADDLTTFRGTSVERNEDILTKPPCMSISIRHSSSSSSVSSIDSRSSSSLRGSVSDSVSTFSCSSSGYGSEISSEPEHRNCIEYIRLTSGKIFNSSDIVFLCLQITESHVVKNYTLPHLRVANLYYLGV